MKDNNKALNDASSKALSNSSPADQNAQSGQRLRNLQKDGTPFTRTVTLTSAAGDTPISIITDSEVGDNEKVHVYDFHAKVNGGTVWATIANVKVQDTDAVDFITMLVAALTANAFVGLFTSNITPESALELNSGGTLGKGLQVVANATGTGSDLVITVSGVVK